MGQLGALSSGNGGSVRLWDVETGRELKELGHPEHVLSAEFTPDGRHAVTAGGGRNGPEGAEAEEDFAIWLWELPAEQGGKEGRSPAAEGKESPKRSLHRERGPRRFPNMPTRPRG